MDEQQRQYYLDALGVTRWQLRVPLEAEQEPPPIEELVADVEPQPEHQPRSRAEPAPQPISTPSSRSSEKPDWQTLREQVRNCRRCGLREGCTQTVFGVGDTQARLLVIGEAPGADEDRQGEPFVGRAGQLLNAMLLAMGFRREEVFIANIVKCRPPNNRDPRAEEALSCEPYLLRQIELIQPRAILAVGRIAAQNLLKSDLAVGKLRGRMHALGEARIPLVVTYHPAYLLRSPEHKGRAWQDLQMALSVLREAP
ncbi:MAG: uracil-DNA glycosylase [Candidatus Thiodiazotropha sp.]